MAVDARISAWICAWNRLEAAHKINRDNVNSEPLPEYYWTLLNESAIYADLASAPTDVGIAAGEFLDAEEKRRIKERERIEEIFNGRP